jgi:hypothetical protein
MIRSVVNVVMGTEGAFGYEEVLRMEISEFQDVVKEIEIIRSADKFEQDRIENHNNAKGFR